MPPIPITVGLANGSWQDKVNYFSSACARVKTALYYRRIFGAIGEGSRIYKPILLSNPRFVFIGHHTMIRPGARIETIVLNGERPPSLTIGDNVNIEQNVHLVCSSSVLIGNDVTITGNCAIVDTTHPFQDLMDTQKIGDRIDPRPTPVEIGENTFVGFGSIVLPGVRIGRRCVIGANSVVTRDIPDFSVVAGNPAQILKQYNQSTSKWIRFK